MKIVPGDLVQLAHQKVYGSWLVVAVRYNQHGMWECSVVNSYGVERYYAEYFQVLSTSKV